MAFEILRGKIAHAAADAVICPTGSRAESEVLSAAGRGLRRDRESRGHPDPGTALAIKARLPKTKYVVFAAMPGEDGSSIEERRQTYISA
ncbi:MAG: hypothetical protein ILP09_06530, partial [Oscillospiraceae bacterium]|nr:hypothetical protein [Oscillospiraceae bacterium]